MKMFLSSGVQPKGFSGVGSTSPGRSTTRCMLLVRLRISILGRNCMRGAFSVSAVTSFSVAMRLPVETTRNEPRSARATDRPASISSRTISARAAMALRTSARESAVALMIRFST